MNKIKLKIENIEYQKKIKSEVLIDGTDMIHKHDGGIFKRYLQNPPHPPVLYGCSSCGAYFELDA